MAVVALAVPFGASVLDASPLVAPPAAGTAGPFDPNVGAQLPWTRDALPAILDEPVAMVVNAGADVRVVGASGRQWGLASNTNGAVVAPDGRALAWWDSNAQVLHIRDLEFGTEHRLPAGVADRFDGIHINPQLRMHWSPDSTIVALTSPQGLVTLVQKESGEATVLEGVQGVVAGWRGPDRLVLTGFPDGGNGSPVSETTIDGTQVPLPRITVPGDPTMGVEMDPVVSTDGQSLAWADHRGPQIQLVVWDIETGTRRTVPCACGISDWLTWTSSGLVVVQIADQSPTMFGTLDVETGSVEALIALSPRVGQPVNLSLATTVIASGPSGPPHTSRWWPGWYVDWITYAFVVLLLAVGLLLAISARRRRSPAGR